MIITLTNGVDTVCKGYFYRNLRKNDLSDIERGKLLAEVLDVSLDDLVNYDRENSNDLGLGVPPKGKHVFGITKVGEKGQIVIPAKARKIFDIQPGDNLILLGDESQGIAIIKEKRLVEILNGNE